MPKNFVLVYCEDDIANPFMKLQLTDDNKFKIISQREIDETEEDLMDKLNHLAIKVVEAIQLGFDLSAISLSTENKPNLHTYKHLYTQTHTHKTKGRNYKRKD